MARIVGLIALCTILGESAALADSCKVHNTGPSGQWKFVHVYDADTGDMVLSEAISGGENRDIAVSGHRVRIDSKLPGGRTFKTGVVTDCKGGNTIRF